MFNKNVLNNSYTTPRSYSNDKFSKIFTRIKPREIKKRNRAKTARQIEQNLKKLNKALSIKNRKMLKKSQESISVTFNADTWVNKLPFLYKENKKVKNYERIYFELNKLFEKEKKNEENENYYIQLYNNSGEKNMNTSNNDLEIDYDIDDYIKIVKKAPNVRTMLDVYLIIKFLSKTRLGKSFKDEFIDKEIFGKLITFCGMEIKYRRFS